MLSRNAISRAGEGLPSSSDSFRHAKIAAMTPRGLFAAFIHFFFHRGSPHGFAAEEGNYSLSFRVLESRHHVHAKTLSKIPRLST